jgi:hypothetical protein
MNQGIPLPVAPNHIPPSVTPNDYWYRLHNLLQKRGWSNRLHSREWKAGRDDSLTWHSFCRCLFHFFLRLPSSYTSPTVDGQGIEDWGMDYGWGNGVKKMEAKNTAARVIFYRFLYRAAMPLIERRLNEIS